MSPRWGMFLLPVLCNWWSGVAAPLHRLVVTTQGAVRGYYAPQPPHYVYRGVPYARPPTNYDRFKAPEPPPPWSGIFEATHRVRCPQPDGSGEENCLVLNIFVPERAAASPVLVHFHGGGFQRGWGFHTGPRRLLEQGFVVVSFNYRLGVLGFLCLGLPDVLGNTGLKDQIAALYWIHRNIDKFGGDPGDVTAYGTGSGAVSIELLQLSGFTKNLFGKVILESGSAFSPSAISHEPTSDAFNFAKELGYKYDSKPVLLQEFFYKVSYKSISNTSYSFLPCIESEDFTNSLILKDPRDGNNAKHQNVPTMVIYTNADEVSIIAENMDRFNAIPHNFENLLPSNLVFDSDKTKNKVANIVKEFYFDDYTITKNVVQSYISYVNDVFMEYPVVKSAAYHANNGNVVYLMKYLYEGKLSSKKYGIPGANFGDILKFITSNVHLEDSDEIVSEKLITLLNNFIRLGDPTPLTTLLIPEVWQPLVPYTVNNKIVLRNVPCLTFRQSMTNSLLSGQQLVFWDHIYEKFYINSSEK